MRRVGNSFGGLPNPVFNRLCIVIVIRFEFFGHPIVAKVFFQAEDGIRDSVASRGLGDVYKRQPQNDKLT